MEKIVELYIEDIKVDLDENVVISLKKQLIDIYDPSKIKNDFTKTISLPNSKTNDLVFGNIFGLSKIISTTTGVTNINQNFNPSKKSKFRLFLNDSMIFSGYMKMINITYTSDSVWRYEINLFGEIGTFFNLFGDENLSDTLSGNSSYTNNRIDYVSPYTLINTIPDNFKYPLYNLWETRRFSVEYDGFTVKREDITPSTLYSNDYTIDPKFSGTTYYRNIYLDLIDAENGMMVNSEFFNFDGLDSQFMGGEEKFKLKYTEQQVCLKKEINQRLGWYIDKLIIDTIKSKGYTVDNIGGQWMNVDNPYWNKILTNGNLLKKTKNKFQLITSGNTVYTNSNSFTNTLIYSYSPRNTALVSTTLTTGYTMGGTVNAAYLPDNIFSCSVNTQPVIFNDLVKPNRFSVQYIRTEPTVNTSVFRCIGLPTTGNTTTYFTPSDSTIHYFDFMVILTSFSTNIFPTQRIVRQIRIRLASNSFVRALSNPNEQNVYEFRIKNFGNTNDSYIEIYKIATATWEKLDDFIYQNYSTFKMEKNNQFINQNVAIIYSVDKSRRTTHNVSNGTTTVTMASLTLGYRQTNFNLKIDSIEDIEAGQTIWYDELLPNLKTKDFLISYIKMFGLILNVNNDTKTVSILTKNEYFSSGSTDKNYDNYFCENLESSQNPLNFDSKYIELSYGKNDTELSKNYFNKYNKETGSKILNTGYDFSENKYNLLDGNVFKNYITFTQNQYIYGIDDDPKIIPALYSGELQNSKPSEGNYLFFIWGYKGNNYTAFLPSTRPGYSPSMFFGFFAGDNSYNNIITNIKGYDFSNYEYLIDEFGNLKLVVKSNTVGALGSNKWSGQKYLQTTNFYPTPEHITHTLDFGRPDEIYMTNPYPTYGVTIYDRCWKKYLEDRYSVQTKVFTGYFKLEEGELNNLKLSDFIYFKDRIWSINYIEQNNILSDEPVKLQLVSVNDINNYTNSVNVVDVIPG